MKEKTRIVFYTKLSCKQSSFLTIVKEWYVGKEVTYAKLLKMI